ncbi:hypothetical protein ACRAWD_30925 [Caulobacter segnis]
MQRDPLRLPRRHQRPAAIPGRAGARREIRMYRGAGQGRERRGRQVAAVQQGIEG